jgi:ABC-type Zn uptake system ZnuABC Zn-binding protein ZnuA
MIRNSLVRNIAVVLLILIITGCGKNETDLRTAKLRVIATTSIIGDVVLNVAGNRIDLDVLVPNNSDPHSFEPTPRTLAEIGQADLIFINGAGLEQALERIIHTSGDPGKVVSVSRELEKDIIEKTGQAVPDGSVQHDTEDGHLHEIDPHFWFDPNNVISWVEVIAGTLARLDTANAAYYREQKAQYTGRLIALDAWIRELVQQIPQDRRKLVCDHLVLGYFAKRYGFEQVGAIIPGFNALSEPSARDIARLQDTIHKKSIPCIFLGHREGAQRAGQFALDSGVKVMYLFTGSLSDSSLGADSYINFMRQNTISIVNGLKE